MRVIRQLTNGQTITISVSPKTVAGKSYQRAATYWGGGGRKIEKTHPTDAAQAVQRVVDEAERRVFNNLNFKQLLKDEPEPTPEPKTTSRTFEDWAEQVVSDLERAAKAERKSESYAALCRSFLNLYVKGSWFGETPIHSLNHPSLVVRFVDEAKAKPYKRGKKTYTGHSSQWAMLLRRFLSKVFNDARDVDPTIPQPVTKQTYFRVEHSYRGDLFSTAEMEALFRVARTMQERIILAFGFWGVRPAEICAARWSKLSPDGTTYMLDKQIKWTRASGKTQYVERKPKTDRTVRRIALAPGHFLFETLQAAKAVRDEAEDFMLTVEGRGGKPRRCTSDDISRLIPELCKLAEIPVRNAYQMKSSAITLMLLSEIDVKTVSAITGVSEGTILKHYDRAKSLERQQLALPKVTLKVA